MTEKILTNEYLQEKIFNDENSSFKFPYNLEINKKYIFHSLKNNIISLVETSKEESENCFFVFTYKGKENENYLFDVDGEELSFYEENLKYYCEKHFSDNKKIKSFLSL